MFIHKTAYCDGKRLPARRKQIAKCGDAALQIRKQHGRIAFILQKGQFRYGCGVSAFKAQASDQTVQIGIYLLRNALFRKGSSLRMRPRRACAASFSPLRIRL